MNQRQTIFANIRRLTNHFMFIALGSQIDVPFPAVAAHDTARSNCIHDRRYQTFLGTIRYQTKPNTANMPILVLGRNEYQGFSFSSTAPFPFMFTTNIGFINFNNTRQAVTARANHGYSQSVKPFPCCLMSCKSQYALKAQGADSIFLANHIPYRHEPYLQRIPRVLKNCSCCYGCLMR